MGHTLRIHDAELIHRESAVASMILALVAVLTLTIVVAAQEKPQSAIQQPTFSMFYSYKCQPENRPALRKYMETTGVRQFEQWKSQGVIKDYIILFASFVRINSVPWDMVVRVDFNRYADTEKWREIERTMPAGLPAQILSLAMPENLQFSETLAAQGMEPRNAGSAIYDVGYYRFKVPLNAGKDFIQGYIMPQLNAFLSEKVIAGYGLYLNRYEGTDWSYLIISEYSDIATFDLRVSNKGKIRSLLDPAWKTLHEIKSEHIRDEPHGFIADRIVPGGH